MTRVLNKVKMTKEQSKNLESFMVCLQKEYESGHFAFDIKMVVYIFLTQF